MKTCPTCGQNIPGIAGRRVCSDCGRQIRRFHKWYIGGMASCITAPARDLNPMARIWTRRKRWN